MNQTSGNGLLERHTRRRRQGRRACRVEKVPREGMSNDHDHGRCKALHGPLKLDTIKKKRQQPEGPENAYSKKTALPSMHLVI